MPARRWLPARERALVPASVRELLPAPTVRLRLSLLYGAVFLLTGAVLLTIGYALVRHGLDAPADVRNALHRLGLTPPRGRFAGRPPRPDPRFARLGEAVRSELRSAALHRLVYEYVVALAAMTVVSVAAGWLLAGRALRPLRQITATARRVSGENLGERIDLEGPADELKELADTFDGMLQRLDGAFASQRHFVANASHELRTPLAIMRTEVDVSMADPEASTDELRAMGDAVRETIDRCERLISSLLFLARSEAIAGREESVDLAALAADCLTDMRARARAADVEMRSALVPAWTRGEPALIERMIANLIENAIRHNRRGGFLEVRTLREPDTVSIVVVNGGVPIAPEDAATLMEPFRRLDRGREGFGLGLSIVASVAHAHGGRASVQARDEGGLEVWVRLPAEPVAANVGVVRSSASLTRS
jgi:signal transduction histidine kinase